MDDALHVIDDSLDYICPKRLTPDVVRMARRVDRHSGLRATPSLVDQLGSVSFSASQRRLHRLRSDQRRLARKKPRGGSQLVRDVPKRRVSRDLARP